MIDAEFHDFKKAGVPPVRLDARSARDVMLAQPSVIKRLVVEWNADTVTLGFDPEQWAAQAAAR